MAKVPLTVEQVDARTAYRAMQRALRVLVGLIHPSDPDKIVHHLVESMDKLVAKFGKDIQ